MSTIRQWAQIVTRTPLHPKWLSGARKVPSGIKCISGHILDIGAADRWIESRLPKCVEYVALDYPATGRELYGSKPDVFSDGACLPFSDECFDGVVCLEVLEHVPDPASVMSELARVLKSGGRAWISMPFLYPLHDAPFDFQRYTEYGLRRDAFRAGLEIVSLRKLGHAIRAAGLLVSLAVDGGMYARSGWLKWALLPLSLAFVSLINVTAWLLSCVWPDWKHIGKGHELEVRKP
jgi:SAM-dependent methyltransferase